MSSLSSCRIETLHNFKWYILRSLTEVRGFGSVGNRQVQLNSHVAVPTAYTYSPQLSTKWFTCTCPSMLFAIKTLFNLPLCSNGLYAVATLRFVHQPVGEPVSVSASARQALSIHFGNNASCGHQNCRNVTSSAETVWWPAVLYCRISGLLTAKF